MKCIRDIGEVNIEPILLRRRRSRLWTMVCRAQGFYIHKKKHTIYAIIVGPVAHKRTLVTTGPRYTAYIIGGVSAFLLLDILWNILIRLVR